MTVKKIKEYGNKWAGWGEKKRDDMAEDYPKLDQYASDFQRKERSLKRGK